MTIRGNNVAHFDALVAPIHLGVEAKYCTVIGDPKDVLVYEGTHNTIGGPARSIRRSRR